MLSRLTKSDNAIFSISVKVKVIDIGVIWKGIFSGIRTKITEKH